MSLKCNFPFFFFLLFLNGFLSCQGVKKSDELKKIEKISIVSNFYTIDTKRVVITDKKTIKKLYEKISLLKNLSEDQIKPFEGSLTVSFIYYDGEGRASFYNKLETGVIIKKNDSFLIRKHNGIFKDDELAKEIIDLYKININPIPRIYNPCQQ